MSQAIEITGTVERATLCRFKGRDNRYGNPTENYDRTVHVGLKTPEGRVEFYTPRVKESIALGGSAAVRIFMFGGSRPAGERNEDAWMRAVNPDDAVSVPGRACKASLESKIKVGDRLTITGRLRSQNGSHRILNYVKLLKQARPCEECGDDAEPGKPLCRGCREFMEAAP